jgi:hypothetical protein
VEHVADEVCHALAADAVETPLVMRAGDGLLFEDSVIQRHIPMRTAPAISLELYKFLFDLTDGGNWLFDVHASS